MSDTNPARRNYFEYRPKTKSITLRISEELLTAIKAQAKASGLEYQKFIRIKLEEQLGEATAPEQTT